MQVSVSGNRAAVHPEESVKMINLGELQYSGGTATIVPVSEQMFDPWRPRLYQLRDGRWAESRPDGCPLPPKGCGLPWPLGTDGRVLVGTHKCRCNEIGSHRTYQCERCRRIEFVPPLVEGCTKEASTKAPSSDGTVDPQPPDEPS